jgi:hypothetical protein
MKLVTMGVRIVSGGSSLYSEEPYRTVPCEITLVPYYAWNNRGPGEMRVWLESL